MFYKDREKSASTNRLYFCSNNSPCLRASACNKWTKLAVFVEKLRFDFWKKIAQTNHLHLHINDRVKGGKLKVAMERPTSSSFYLHFNIINRRLFFVTNIKSTSAILRFLPEVLFSILATAKKTIHFDKFRFVSSKRSHQLLNAQFFFSTCASFFPPWRENAVQRTIENKQNEYVVNWICAYAFIGWCVRRFCKGWYSPILSSVDYSLRNLLFRRHKNEQKSTSCRYKNIIN